MSATPYSLLRDLFAFRFDILESDSAETLRQKLETGQGEFLEQEGQMKAHFIGSLLGYNFQNSPHQMGVQNDPNQLREQALFYLGSFLQQSPSAPPRCYFWKISIGQMRRRWQLSSSSSGRTRACAC